MSARESFNETIRKSGKGMNELATIVAGLQKDVKKINKAITLDGAQEYAAKKPFNRKTGRGWTAHEADITGPNGKPDGIQEVYVLDGNGRLKVINGYGLKRTEYPMRKLQRTIGQIPEEFDRWDNPKLVPFNKFKSDMNKLGISPTGMPYYTTHLDEQYAGIHKNKKGEEVIKPRNVFKQMFIDPILEFSDHKSALQRYGFSGLELARVIKQMISEIYTEFILKNVFNTSDPNELKKLVNKKAGIDSTIRYISELLEKKQNKDEEFTNLHTRISEFMDHYIDSVISSIQ